MRMRDTVKLFEPRALDANNKAQLLRVLQKLDGIERLHRAKFLRENFVVDEGSIPAMQLNACISLLADLAEQGWDIRVTNNRIELEPHELRTLPNESVDEAKKRARIGLQRASNRQLAEPSVQVFLRKIEKPRLYNGQSRSIADLIDNGSDLASKIGEGDYASVRKFIRPVIQECDTTQRCEFTGLRLQDIWRYFRHTWALEYNPLPGRTLRLLIRNSARPNWPIMGIAMLASPAANLYIRDEWIKWRGVNDVITGLLENKWEPKVVSKTLLSTIRTAISDIRYDDLLDPVEVEEPTTHTFFKLDQIVAKATASRKGDLTSNDANAVIDIRGMGSNKITSDHWRQLSETSLFRKKRAEQLIPLLRTLDFFKRSDFERAPSAAVFEVLTEKRGREAVGIALNEIKKKRLATEIADVAVCGAIPPYNELLGGKLVTLLMGSQEVRDIYANRYGNQPSEIASQIAGRPIVRSADLKVLTTTSLYGIGANQYTRTRIGPNDSEKLKRPVNWEYLGKTTGFTVTHVSRQTVGFMRKLAIETYGRRRINSVFGEGSSPRIRQIREGLNLLGINNDDVLRQSVGRRVYAYEYFPNARDALIGFSAKARSVKSASGNAITEGWLKKWLLPRIRRADVLERLHKINSGIVINALRDRAMDGQLEFLPEDLGPTKILPLLEGHLNFD